MLAGELFILFGLNVKDETFRAAYKQLYALQVVASEVVGVVRSIGEGLTELAVQSAAAGTHLLGTAASLGMSTKSVQEWSYVAKQAGSNIDQFVVGVSMFERNLREFAVGRGSKRFKDAMAEVGMSQAQAKAALNGPDGINAAIFQVSDAYVRMGNTANRAAINTGLFGARARGMAQDLGQGSAALRQRINELHEIGGVVGNDDLQKLKEFDNSITKIKTSLNALAMQVVAQLGPAFTEFLDSITKWVAENRTLIEDVLAGAFKVLAFAFKLLFDMVKALGALIQGVMNGDAGALFLFSGLLAVIVSLAGAIITLLLPAIIIMGDALWTAMAPLLPIMFILAGLIALTILIIQHWQGIKDWFSDFGTWLSNFFSHIGDDLVSVGQWFADKWHGFIDGIKAAFWVAFDAIVQGAIWAVNKVIGLINLIPGVDVGNVGIPDWAKHNTATEDAQASTSPGAAARPQSPGVPGSPNVGFGAPTGKSNGGPVASSVSIAPTTVNIYGVKDAKEASGHIADTIDEHNRHAAAALGGEVG